MSPTDKAATIARVLLLMEEDHLSQNAACARVGIPSSSFGRWRKALAEHNGDAFAAFGEKKTGGRPRAIRFSALETKIARGHRLQKESLEWAIHFFCVDPRVGSEIRPDTVAKLRAIQERYLELQRETVWPKSVRDTFYVTAQELAAFRSKKEVQSAEMVTRRSLTWIDEEGQVHDLLPGEMWEADDYSGNQPYVYRDPVTGELELGRQILAMKDITDQAWLGFDMIGRPRDAYRGEDIVRFLGRCFRAHGLPRFLRLEKGSWQSSYIHGIPHLANGTIAKNLPKNWNPSAEKELGVTRWGGLDRLCHISHVRSSKAKGSVEGGFAVLQRVLSHSARDVGRYAGEYDEAAKAWRQARKNLTVTDPTELGFFTQEQVAAAHEEAALLINAKPMRRQALDRYVSPHDLRQEMGWHTHPLPEKEAWRLLPYKERRVVRAGMVTVNPEHGWPEMTYVVNGNEGLSLQTGHAVFIAYDPADPATAYVANADASAKNREGWPVGHFLALAPIYEVAPQIDLSGKKHSSISYRRKATAAASTHFRAIRDQLTKGEVEKTATTGTRSIIAGNLDSPGNEEVEQATRERAQASQAIDRAGSTDMRGGRQGLASADELERIRAQEDELMGA